MAMCCSLQKKFMYYFHSFKLFFLVQSEQTINSIKMSSLTAVVIETKNMHFRLSVPCLTDKSRFYGIIINILSFETFILEFVEKIWVERSERTDHTYMRTRKGDISFEEIWPCKSVGLKMWIIKYTIMMRKTPTTWSKRQKKNIY